MSRKPKKIKFALDDYKSETVFSQLSPWVKKKKTTFDGKDAHRKSEISRKLDSRLPTPYKSKNSRKRQLVISYSSESFEENFDETISPSRSEVPKAKIHDRQSIKRGPSIIEISDSEESVDSFDLSDFFNTREHSLNESITEAHSGIDYEFMNDGVKKVQIHAKQILDFDSDKSANDESSFLFSEKSDDVGETQESLRPTEDSSAPDQSNQNRLNSQNTFVDESIHSVSTSSATEADNCDVLTPSKRCLDQKVAKYCETEEEKLVILKENSSLPFFGLISLKVLHGNIEVLGHCLNEHSREISLYSPRGSALLVVKNITVNGQGRDLRPILAILKKNSSSQDFVVTENSAVFSYRKLDDNAMKFTEKYISQQIFPKFDNNNAARVIFELKDEWNAVTVNPLWDQVLSCITTSTKLLITGGRGVGKSTFLRYAINRLLNRYDRVRIVDLDPGQSEFTIPGCISVFTITEPVFGPNYTHLSKAERSYISHINVGHEPLTYLRNVELLMEKLTIENDIPTLINYIGFVQGIGLNIVSSAITYILPTDVVQISSKSSTKNFTKDLSVELVKQNCHLFGGDPDKVSFELHKIDAMNDSNTGWTLEPRQAREMCVLSYLGRMMSANVLSLTSSKLPMYEISLDSISITNSDGEEISPAAANANLVALCSTKETGTHGVFRCLGHGVIRGIDFINNTLILLTPEAPDVLEHVFYLVIGSVTLPPSVYMTPDEITGNIPYVMEGELVSLGQLTKRSYVPVNKK